MTTSSTNPTTPTWSSHWQHATAWLAGILAALLPFVAEYNIPFTQAFFRQGPGYFGVNLLTVTTLCFVGGIIGGYWWRFSNHLVGNKNPILIAASIIFLAASTTAYFIEIPHFYYYLLAFLILTLTYFWINRSSQYAKPFSQGFRQRRSFNGIFFIILFLALVAHNIILIVALHLPKAETTSAIIGRICTQAIITGILYLLSELALRATPKFMRITPWIVLGLAPFLALLDLMLSLLWGRSLLHVVNALTQSGRFSLQEELDASGTGITVIPALLILAGVLAVTTLLAWALFSISKKLKLTHSLKAGLIIVIVAFIGLLAEQAIGQNWKSLAAWQQIHRTFLVHLDTISPPRGVAKYKATFQTAQIEIPQNITPTSKPDIYFIMVESMRADTITPEITPFLYDFKNDCQQLGKTWSASNATHLSWFSTFHARLPIYWRSSLENIPDRETYKGSSPLQILVNAGYDLQVRAVCDLGYKDFGMLNFGTDTNLASIVEQANDGSLLNNLTVPEREAKHFQTLINSTSSTPAGSHFYYTALDAPHYNYYWHKDFDVPFKDYMKEVYFPISPSKEEIQSIKHRYWNSCAWVDSQIKLLVNHLKEQDRYDNAIIIVTGDHGEEFQEDGGWFHCSSLHPEQTNVPILIKWPKSLGKTPAHTNASHTDIMPSILAATGIDNPELNKLAGKNLLDPAPATSFTSTAFAGKTGETMMLHNGDFTAAFSWPNYWDANVPQEITLERIEGPNGPIILKNKSDYLPALKKHFPDAFQRFFKSLELTEE